MIYYIDKKKKHIVNYKKNPIKLHTYFYPVNKNENNLRDFIFYSPPIYNWNIMIKTLNDYFFTDDKTKFKAIKESLCFILNDNFNFSLPVDNEIFISKPVSSNGIIPIFQICIGKKNKNEDISSIYKFKLYERNNTICITSFDQKSIENYVFKNRGFDLFPKNLKTHFDNEAKKTVNSLTKCFFEKETSPLVPCRTITSTIEDLKLNINYSVKPLSVVEEYKDSTYLQSKKNIEENHHSFSVEPLKIVEDYYSHLTPELVKIVKK